MIIQKVISNIGVRSPRWELMNLWGEGGEDAESDAWRWKGRREGASFHVCSHASSLRTSPSSSLSLSLFLMILYPWTTAPLHALLMCERASNRHMTRHKGFHCVPACLVLPARQASDVLPCNLAGKLRVASLPPFLSLFSLSPSLEIWCTALTQPDRRATKTTLLGALEWEFALGRGGDLHVLCVFFEREGDWFCWPGGLSTLWLQESCGNN